MAYSSTLSTSMWNCSSVCCETEWADGSSLIRWAARAILHLNRVATHVRFPPWRQLRGKKSFSAWLLNPALGDFLASVRLREIEGRADRDDAGGINFRVRHVVMTLDMIEVDGLGDTGLLIKVHQVTLQARVIDDAPDVALEVAVINRVESN